MRKTLDQLISWTGLILAVVLLAGGGLLIYASNFVHQNVEDQLSQQRITMPAVDRLETQAQKDALAQYAGQQMTTGDQAKAFADQYILVHMNASSDGRTYEEVSGEYMQMAKDPNASADEVKALGDLRQSLFMGNALRGMLLNAYAFGTMGTIALIAGIGAFIASGVLLVLSFFGFRHAKQVNDFAPEDITNQAPARV